MRLGAVRRRRRERRELVQAQDVDRAQACHPPDPGWGWRSRAAVAGWEPGIREDEQGPTWGPLENTGVCGGRHVAC